MRRFIIIFVSLLFIAIHYGAILYVNSSLLSNFFGSGVVGLLFILGALGNILLFLLAPKLIQKFGKRILLFFSLVISILTTVGMTFFTTELPVAISFVIYTSFVSIIFYCLDIFLEELSTDARTGEIRGIYLTCVALGMTLGPFILAILSTTNSGLKPTYLAAAFLLIPPLLLSIFSFKSRTPRAHHPYHHSLRLPFGAWWRARSIRHVTLARLALEAFFSFMVAYAPIYLHNNLGFEWSELGIMFAIMLLPFIFLEWPAGELADRLLGEKELMVVGFLITGASLLIMPFIGKVFLAWTVILLISRIGASLIESMTESYFFKHVSAEETGLLSIFRLTRSMGNVSGVVVGTIALSLFPFEKTFFVLAIVIFLGLKESLHLRDTL